MITFFGTTRLLMVTGVIREMQRKLRKASCAVGLDRQVLNGQFAAAHGAYTCWAKTSESFGLAPSHKIERICKCSTTIKKRKSIRANHPEQVGYIKLSYYLQTSSFRNLLIFSVCVWNWQTTKLEGKNTQPTIMQVRIWKPAATFIWHLRAYAIEICKPTDDYDVITHVPV